MLVLAGNSQSVTSELSRRLCACKVPRTQRLRAAANGCIMACSTRTLDPAKLHKFKQVQLP